MIRGLKQYGIALGALLVMTGIASAEVHFRNVSFDEAKKLAAKEHKAVMVDFYTSWCGWCKVLDRKTYTDDNVGRIADEKFVSVKIDAEKGEGVALAKAGKVTGYPTIVFYTSEGKEIDRVVGYEDADRFARSLELAAAGGAKAVINEVEGSNTVTDPGKWLVAANYYAEHRENAKAVAAFQKVVTLDPDNKHGKK